MFVREVDFKTLETGSGREAREIIDPVSEEAWLSLELWRRCLENLCSICWLTDSPVGLLCVSEVTAPPPQFLRPGDGERLLARPRGCWQPDTADIWGCRQSPGLPCHVTQTPDTVIDYFLLTTDTREKVRFQLFIWNENLINPQNALGGISPIMIDHDLKCLPGWSEVFSVQVRLYPDQRRQLPAEVRHGYRSRRARALPLPPVRPPRRGRGRGFVRRLRAVKIVIKGGWLIHPVQPSATRVSQCLTPWPGDWAVCHGWSVTWHVWCHVLSSPGGDRWHLPVWWGWPGPAPHAGGAAVSAPWSPVVRMLVSGQLPHSGVHRGYGPRIPGPLLVIIRIHITYVPSSHS